MDMKVDVVKELWCLSYGVLVKSAPAHEGIEKCYKCSYKKSSRKYLNITKNINELHFKVMCDIDYVWYRCYWEESFEGTYLVCTWNIPVPLQQMRIEGIQSRIYVVSWHAYFKSSFCKAHWIFTWHGKLTKFKEPPISMCILCKVPYQ